MSLFSSKRAATEPAHFERDDCGWPGAVAV